VSEDLHRLRHGAAHVLAQADDSFGGNGK